MSQPTATRHSSTAAILLLVLQALGVVVCGFLAIMLVFVSDACDATSCDTDLIATGMMITALVPIALFVASVVHVIVRARRNESSWWVPLLWMGITAVAAVAGIMTSFQGGPNTFT